MSIVTTEIESVHGSVNDPQRLVFYRCQDHLGQWRPYGPVFAAPSFDAEAHKAVVASRVAESLAAAEFAEAVG